MWLGSDDRLPAVPHRVTVLLLVATLCGLAACKDSRSEDAVADPVGAAHGPAQEHLPGGGAGSQFHTVVVEGTGEPGLVLEVRDTAAAAASLSVEVYLSDEGGIEGWERVGRLESAGPDDKVFQVEARPGKTSLIHFGDGTHGAIPRAGKRVFRIRYIGGGDLAEGEDAIRLVKTVTPQ